MGIYHRFLIGSSLIISSLIITSSIACAETIERSLLLSSNNNQSFKTFLQQAEDLAINSIEQEFTVNHEVTEVSITILGESNGQIAPLLRSNVSRTQWQRDARISRWTKYFTVNSGVLLGFYNSSASHSSPSQTPQVVPVRTRVENEPGFRDD